VIARLTVKRVVRTLPAAAAALMGFLLLSGCDDKYDKSLTYPVRTDPLVLETFKQTPTQIDPPGDFDKPGFLYAQPNVPAEEKESKLLDPSKLSADQKHQMAAALEEMFGTPREPKVPTDFEGGGDEFVTLLRLDGDTLAEGSRLYRIHCLHCHGLSGNGRGPTSPWVNPHPRDYRQGKFKFTSVPQSAGGNDRKPRRGDLLRTLRAGIDGTSMPSFGLLEDDELQALASYVIHLSMRGQAEFMTIRSILKTRKDEDVDPKDQLKEDIEIIASRWKLADKNVIRPPEPKAPDMAKSIQHGHQLFLAKGCIGCHIDYGRQATYFYDDWGTIGRPADLTQSTYRGGRRPVDLYYRLDSGINGSNMPASGLKPDEIWDVVNFLQVLPYRDSRKEYQIAIHSD